MVILSSLTMGISLAKKRWTRYIYGLCSHNATARSHRQSSPPRKALSRSKTSSAPALFIKMFSASQCTRKYLALALVLSFQDVRAWRSTFRLSAAGDVTGEVKDVSSDDPNVKAVYDLVRESDFELFNMEGNIFYLATFPGYPASENGKDNAGGGVGGGARYEAEMAAALAAVGFTVASHANNHALMLAGHLQNMTRVRH
ncbi:hypothetical protein FJTKL_11437 [Diaporthe vaccinii]|uniref:Uncharacterized protein n=1 Tax=Diaporthe vaccinii TaxID=105482 RepID=A0ABR4EH44_9PEZI